MNHSTPTALGIDCGLAKGKGTMLCRVDSSGVTWNRVAPQPLPELQKLQRTVAGIWALLPDEPAVVCIERPMGLRGNAVPLIGLYYLLAAQIAARHVTYSCVPPSVKMFIAGKGNADKAQVGSSAYRLWRGLLDGKEQLNEDEADSLGIALLGLCAAGLECPAGAWTAYQVRAAEKVGRVE